jgi:hypothetical protein
MNRRGFLSKCSHAIAGALFCGALEWCGHTVPDVPEPEPWIVRVQIPTGDGRVSTYFFKAPGVAWEAVTKMPFSEMEISMAPPENPFEAEWVPVEVRPGSDWG